MGAIASQITSLPIVYSAVNSDADKKQTSKLRVTGFCVGNSPGTGEFPAQLASNAENVSIRWRHHVCAFQGYVYNKSFVNTTSEIHGCITTQLTYLQCMLDWSLSGHCIVTWMTPQGTSKRSLMKTPNERHFQLQLYLSYKLHSSFKPIWIF